jgi:hypothetical protein
VKVLGAFTKGSLDLSLRKQKKKKKRTALVICHDGKQFWTTQAEFWQWIRQQLVVKLGDNPLTGLLREHEEKMVLINHTVLNLAAPNHMREAMLSRRKKKL